MQKLETDTVFLEKKGLVVRQLTSLGYDTLHWSFDWQQ
jgi:hypothetical protein